MTDVDLVVAGAGPTGATLALQAHAGGATVQVVDRRLDRPRPSRAMVVHARTLEAVEPLGIAAELLARGAPAPAAVLHLGGAPIVADLGGLDRPGRRVPPLLLIRQAAVEDVLHHALASAGIPVHWGVELAGFEQQAGGVRVHVRSDTGEEARLADYLAGCDGTTSAVRQQLGIGWRGRDLGTEVVLADLDVVDAGLDGSLHAVPARSGLVFLFALGDVAPWRLLATRRATPSPDPITSAELQAILDDAGLPVVIADVAWTARVPMQERLADHYRRGRVLLAGDAAHVHTPAGGLGMNTGIQDAVALGRTVAAAARQRHGSVVVDELLDGYERARRPVARRVLALTHLLFWAEAGTGPVATAVRSRLVPAAAPLLDAALARPRLVTAALDALDRFSAGGRPPAWRCCSRRW